MVTDAYIISSVEWRRGRYFIVVFCDLSVCFAMLRVRADGNDHGPWSCDVIISAFARCTKESV